MKYTRVARIGDEGGQGEVWRARDTDGVEVAIKYVKLPVAISDIGNELQRFEREIRCQKLLSHPNIVRILASNLKTEKPFFVMPLASGSLRGLLRFHPGGMPEQMAIDLMGTVMDAVGFAHRNGVIHRDIKPENILIYGDSPAIADFGLGRRLQSGSATITVANMGLGTVQYSAPEQLIDGHKGDVRSDVYSLGRVLYEAFTGRSPFPRVDVQLVPAAFRHIVFRATRDEPDDRYATVMAMIHEFKIAANGLESFRTPLHRARPLFEVVGAGSSAPTDVAALARLIIEYCDDQELLEEFVNRTTAELMTAFLASSSEEFEQIVLALERYADHHFDFEYVDNVADALVAAYKATSSVGLRTILLQRLMLLGSSHNRYYIADSYCDLVSEAVNEPLYVPIIAGMLHDHPAGKEFMRKSLGRKTLPNLIVLELAA